MNVIVTINFEKKVLILRWCCGWSSIL